MRAPGALEQAAACPHLVACLDQVHSHTWFVMDGVADADNTTAGSQAGDPLGDVFFIAVYTRVCRRAKEALREAGLAMALPWLEGVPFWHAQAEEPPVDSQQEATDGSYLDDAVFMQCWHTAEEALEGARRGAG